MASRQRAAAVNDDLFKWIDEHPDRAFFGFLNFVDAHDPYLPPELFAGRYVDTVNRYRLPVAGYDYSPEEVTELRNMYDASIAYVDAQLGRVLAALRARGRLDNTIVIGTSDHGEEFREHRVMGHSMSLYLPSLHVPLVIRHPATVPAGRRIPQGVGLHDVPATVADLVGLTQTTFPGRSLRDVWTGSPDPAPDAILAHLVEKAEPIPDWYPAAAGPMHAVFLDGYHYIERATGEVELYQYGMDPGERTDPASDPEHAEVRDRARAALERLKTTRREPNQ